MANRFFNNVLALLPFTRARAGDVEAKLDAVSAGFDLVQGEIDANASRALTVDPSEPSIGRLPLKAVRANKGAGYDAGGNPTVVVIATSDQMDAAVVAASVSTTAAATAVSASDSLVGSVNLIQQSLINRGVI